MSKARHDFPRWRDLLQKPDVMMPLTIRWHRSHSHEHLYNPRVWSCCSVFLLLLINGMLSACAVMSTHEVQQYMSDYGAHYVLHRSAWQKDLHFFRFASYLPGDDRIGTSLRDIAQVTDARGSARIVGYETDAAVSEMARQLATQMLEIPRALSAYIPYETGRLDLEITLVPAGYRQASTYSHWVKGTDIRARFSFRVSDDLKMSRRYALRTASHELFHALLRLHNVRKAHPANNEEDAALAIEVCTELRITGTTSEALWRNWGNDIVPEEYFHSTSAAAVSITSATRMHRIWGELFAADSDSKPDDRANRLDAICRQVIAKVFPP